ncbi:MAG: winged helix-turn-helix transcriptional regulator [Candidatus Omnitrophica bacterium]|nr:winged helix-turn-helix transcriptional regulator [Candidatus Omnitrophota bacterium]
MTVTQVFKALGDPIRLKIVKRLSDGSDYTIGNLSENLGITRQGARKQIQVLVSADVVQLKPNGREIRVILNPSKLERARQFISKLEDQWDQRLKALKEFAEE